MTACCERLRQIKEFIESLPPTDPQPDLTRFGNDAAEWMRKELQRERPFPYSYWQKSPPSQRSK